MNLPDDCVVQDFVSILIKGIAGLTLAAGTAAIIVPNYGDVRKEIQIQSVAFGEYTAKLIQTDRKFARDTYRFEIADKNGQILISVPSYSNQIKFDFGNNASTSAVSELERKVEE